MTSRDIPISIPIPIPIPISIPIPIPIPIPITSSILYEYGGEQRKLVTTRALKQYRSLLTSKEIHILQKRRIF